MWSVINFYQNPLNKRTTQSCRFLTSCVSINDVNELTDYCTCAVIVTSLSQTTTLSSVECSSCSPSSGSMSMNRTRQRGSSSVADNTTQFVTGCKWLQCCDCGGYMLAAHSPELVQHGPQLVREVTGWWLDLTMRWGCQPSFHSFITLTCVLSGCFMWLEPQRSLVYVMCKCQ